MVRLEWCPVDIKELPNSKGNSNITRSVRNSVYAGTPTQPLHKNPTEEELFLLMKGFCSTKPFFPTTYTSPLFMKRLCKGLLYPFLIVIRFFVLTPLQSILYCLASNTRSLPRFQSFSAVIHIVIILFYQW